MNKCVRLFMLVAAVICISSALIAQANPTAPKLKDEMRMPWQRNNPDYIRQWLVAGPIKGSLGIDCLAGEAAAQPKDGADLRLPDGSTLKWRTQTPYGDELGFGEMAGNKEGAVVCVYTNVQREKAGNALISLGSGDGVRLWVNGKLVLTKDVERSLTPDEDQVEVPMNAGANNIYIQVLATKSAMLRVLEPGTTLVRTREIGPSIINLKPAAFTIQTDIGAERKDADPVKIEIIRPGGTVVFNAIRPRGAKLPVDAKLWSDGPYEVRLSTHKVDGLLFVTHLNWYKGDSLVKARELAAAAAKADASKPEGFTLKMLATMVDDRLGVKVSEATGNPWEKIHSPLMEFDELMLERKGLTGRVRADGFVRLAYRDEVDGSPQFARAYLPHSYDSKKKWPLVVQLHGYNGANPEYVRWWSADVRHIGIESEFSNHQGVIYIEAHGRGNTTYLGMGDSDIMRVIAEAKRLFSVDINRIYLSGDSMGGWGTWNVAMRHPDVFAAIAPVFGGSDYHSQMSEEQLAKLSPLERFLNEKQSSWAMADGLLNVPILVSHGDADQAVDVNYSRWAVRMLQRWGYNVRYHEYPGRIHEALSNYVNANLGIDWMLQYRRDPNPRHVRIRSAELRYAKAYWASVLQGENPLAFMAVDAEVIDRNVIRLDTQNVLDIALSPSSALVDPAKPVKVVWNGVAQELRMKNNELRLTAADYKPATLHKTQRLPGSMADFGVTPFAVVVGTTSKDPDMVALCRDKATSFVEYWRNWQKIAPRVFKDTELSDADMARYSLLLIGGPDANSVSAKLADKVPLQIAADHITIDGKNFVTKDAAVQMIYPHPLNPERYVWIVAGTSADGMYLVNLNSNRGPDWDYLITDGHIPAFKQQASSLQTSVVSGMFDYNWRANEAYAQLGDPEIRAKGRVLRRPNPNFVVDAKVLESYVGRYQIEKGPLVEVTKDGNRLIAKPQGQSEPLEMVPESEADYLIPKYNIRISFARDSSGKVIGLTGYQGSDFEAKRLD